MRVNAETIAMLTGSINEHQKVINEFTSMVRTIVRLVNAGDVRLRGVFDQNQLPEPAHPIEDFLFTGCGRKLNLRMMKDPDQPYGVVSVFAARNNEALTKMGTFELAVNGDTSVPFITSGGHRPAHVAANINEAEDCVAIALSCMLKAYEV